VLIDTGPTVVDCCRRQLRVDRMLNATADGRQCE
jgi:hypothetical protein